MTSLPATRPRQSFPEISAVSWEHPADRAALQALRAVPGVDEVIRKVLALLGGERGVRLLFQGNAVRIGPAQFPKLWHLHTEVCTTFDWADVPELYVSQTPFFNAGAYGIDKPFIVIHSAAIELLDDDELRVLVSHELGHVMSGHALYRTIAAILALISLGALPMLASIAVLPVRLAFLEWSRKSELSADRAGLLGAQDIVVAHRLDMKMAGGGRGESFAGQLNVDAFMQQAHEYASSSEGLDIVYKVLSSLALTHPMHTVRAAELQRWVSERGVRPHPARRVRAPRSRAEGAADRTGLRRRGQLLRRRGPRAGHPRGGCCPPGRGEGTRSLPKRPAEAVRLLVVGGGGREHALCWALRRENPTADIYCAPGNPGTAEVASNLAIPADDLDRIADAADMYGIDLTVVGPEVPLALGLADRLRAEGRAVFGPGAAAARLEASKAFAKEVMAAAGIPTAASRTFTELDPALDYVEPSPRAPGGEGVGTRGRARVLSSAPPGAKPSTRCARCSEREPSEPPGSTVVIESFLEGEEVSVLAITDGAEVELLPVSQDHKRLLEGDRGPNTGGMGAYSPVSVATPTLLERTRREVLLPALAEMRRREHAVPRSALRRTHGGRAGDPVGRRVQLSAG